MKCEINAEAAKIYPFLFSKTDRYEHLLDDEVWTPSQQATD